MNEWREEWIMDEWWMNECLYSLLQWIHAELNGWMHEYWIVELTSEMNEWMNVYWI